MRSRKGPHPVHLPNPGMAINVDGHGWSGGLSTKRFPGGIELVAVVNHGSDRLFRQP